MVRGMEEMAVLGVGREYIRALPDRLAELVEQGWRLVRKTWVQSIEGYELLLIRHLRDDAPAGEESTGGDW